jgi:hypothetical protein
MKRIVATLAVLIASHGCATWLKAVDDYNNPADDAALKKCRDEGRKARDADAGAEQAYGVYFECTKDAGLR